MIFNVLKVSKSGWAVTTEFTGQRTIVMNFIVSREKFIEREFERRLEKVKESLELGQTVEVLESNLKVYSVIGSKF